MTDCTRKRSFPLLCNGILHIGTLVGACLPACLPTYLPRYSMYSFQNVRNDGGSCELEPMRAQESNYMSYILVKRPSVLATCGPRRNERRRIASSSSSSLPFRCAGFLDHDGAMSSTNQYQSRREH